MKRCKLHSRYDCWESRCQQARTQDNAGSIGIDTDGDLTVGIGSGLAIDTSDGSLEIQVAPGIYIDTDGN
jgi:hypothetical protein